MVLLVNNMKKSSWPEFLGLIDNDIDQAYTEFYKFAINMLTVSPPRIIYAFTEQEKEDITSDIIYFCIKDDFNILKKYKPTGKSFSAWFYILSHNYCIDFFRKKKREYKIFQSNSEPEDIAIEQLININSTDHDSSFDLSRILVKIRKTIGRLSDKCRLLLEMAADELKPKEMTMILGLPKDKNKKVSDDLRECRRKLKNLLLDGGIDLGSILKT